MAMCVPLILGTFRKPAVSPTSKPPGKVSLGKRLEATFGQSPGTVGNTPATFEEAANRRMRLVALEFFIGRQPRILVIEADHEADSDQVVFQVIKEGTAVGIVLQRPADGMHDQSRLMFGRVDFPQLLDADAVGLRIDAVAQIEALEQFAGQRSPATFGKNRLLGQQLHARLEIMAGLAILADTQIAGGDTL
jgi:hypothetical protein